MKYRGSHYRVQTLAEARKRKTSGHGGHTDRKISGQGGHTDRKISGHCCHTDRKISGHGGSVNQHMGDFNPSTLTTRKTSEHGGPVIQNLGDYNPSNKADLAECAAATSESQDAQYQSTSTPVTSKPGSRTPVPAHSPLKPTCDDGAVDDVQKPLDAFPWPPRGSKRLSLHSKKLIIDTDSLLDSRLTDPMEVLINLGFGKPDQEKIQRIPQRFLKSSEVSGNDMEEFVRSEYSNMAKSERVLGLNLQVSCRTSNVTSPLLLQIIERLQESRSEQRMAKTTPAEPEPKLHGRARFSSLIKNIRDMNRGCTGFQSTIRNSPSVLHPENRHLLDLQGQKSPELKRRLVIGQQKYDLCKDGKLIEHKNNANLDKNRMQEEGQLKEKEDGYKSDKYKENNKEDDEKCEIPATSIESNEEEIKIPTKSSYQEATPQGYHPSENPDLSNPLTMQSTSSGLSSQPSRKSFSARGIYPHHCTSRHTTKKVKATDHAVSLEPIGIQGGGRHLKHQNRIEALLSQKWHFVLWIAMCVWTIISVM